MYSTSGVQTEEAGTRTPRSNEGLNSAEELNKDAHDSAVKYEVLWSRSLGFSFSISEFLVCHLDVET